MVGAYVLRVSITRGCAYVLGSGRPRLGVAIGLRHLNATSVWMVGKVWLDWLLVCGKPSPSWPLLVFLTGVLLAGHLMGQAARRMPCAGHEAARDQVRQAPRPDSVGILPRNGTPLTCHPERSGTLRRAHRGSSLRLFDGVVPLSSEAE